MDAIHVREVIPEELAELNELYHHARSFRVRTRAQMILLAVEKGLVAHEIASIVRRDEQTVRRWIKRYNAEGSRGLEDAPHPGAGSKVTPAYRTRLLGVVRLRPRALDLPFSIWSLQRLADFMAEETGLRLSYETVRRTLKANGIVLSRPQHKISSPDAEYQVKKRRLKISGTT